MPAQPNQKLIVFDVDGVLLDTQKGALKDILISLGKEPEVNAIHEEYLRRRHEGPWGLEEMMALYAGLSEIELKNLAFEYCQEHLMPGTEFAIQVLKKKKYVLGAVSANPQFVLDALKEMFSFRFAEGNVLEFENKICTGKLLRKVDRYAKKEILEVFMKKEGWQKNQVVVVGDSLTDLPMSELAGKLIAFHAKDAELRAAADHVIMTKDLTEILEHI